MANIVSYVVDSGYLKIGGKWYAKGEVIRGLAKPVARELIKAGRLVVLEKPSDGLQPPKEPVDPPKDQDAPKVVVDPPGNKPETPKSPKK